MKNTRARIRTINKGITTVLTGSTASDYITYQTGFIADLLVKSIVDPIWLLVEFVIKKPICGCAILGWYFPAPRGYPHCCSWYKGVSMILGHHMTAQQPINYTSKNFWSTTSCSKYNGRILSKQGQWCTIYHIHPYKELYCWIIQSCTIWKYLAKSLKGLVIV